MNSLRMQSCEENFRNEINIPSLFFKNPAIEMAFNEEKSNINMYMKFVIITTFFVSYLVAIRILNEFVVCTFIEEYKLRGTPSLLLLVTIFVLSGLTLELIPQYCQKLRFLKGFPSNCLAIGVAICYSYNMSNQYSSMNPMTFPIHLIAYFNSIPFCFVYCHNWICGEILIGTIILSNELYCLIYNWSTFDKFFMSIENLSVFLSIATCIRFLEYIRRESFYKTYIINIERNKNNEILLNLPHPIVITENSKISFVNNSYTNLASSCIDENQKRDEIIHQNTNQGLLKFNETDLNLKIAEKISNDESKESLKSYILSSKEISQSVLFSFTSESSRITPFEITSSIISFLDHKIMVYSLKDIQNIVDLNEMKARQKYTSIFVGTVSHEFRTPINIIFGNIYSIENNTNFSGSKIYLDNIKLALAYLEIMVQNLIDFSHIREKTLQINKENFKVKEVIDEIILILHPKFQDKNLTLNLKFEIEDEFSICSDKMRIKQIIFNLMTNSCKFTVEGGATLKVSFDSLEKILSFSVFDTGIGIKNEDIPALMKPFSKIKDTFQLNANGFLI